MREFVIPHADAIMLARLHHQLELTAESATLYLSGRLQHGDDVTLHQLLTGLPQQIRTLRLDLHAMGPVDQRVIDTVRPILRHWRTRRRGSVGLSLSSQHVVAIYGESEPVKAGSNAAAESMSDALRATYL
jgi:hypothetical protein